MIVVTTLPKGARRRTSPGSKSSPRSSQIARAELRGLVEQSRSVGVASLTTRELASLHWLARATALHSRLRDALGAQVLHKRRAVARDTDHSTERVRDAVDMVDLVDTCVDCTVPVANRYGGLCHLRRRAHVVVRHQISRAGPARAAPAGQPQRDPVRSRYAAWASVGERQSAPRTRSSSCMASRFASAASRDGSAPP